MNKLITDIIDWSEVWALLIPLTYILLGRFDKPSMKPVVLYVIVGLILNSISTTSFFFHHAMPSWLKNNNVYYNLHSIARVLFFAWYIIRLTQQKHKALNYVILGVYCLLVLFNFIFLKNFFFFSTALFAAESIILLLLFILFILRAMRDDSRSDWTKQPSFLITVGIVLYEAITFSIFLFILPMAESDPEFGLLSLKIYKMTFVVFCILITVALKRSRQGLRRTT